MAKINCIQCGKEKEVASNKIKHGLGKFCSRECSWLHHKGKPLPHSPEWEKNRLRAVREASKNRVYPSGYTRDRKFIDPMLLSLAEKRKTNPDKYKRLAIRNLSKNKSLDLSKENSPNWRGGITEFSKKWRSSNGKKLEEWRQAIYLRDGRRCRACGSRDRIEAHHIISLAESRESAFLPMNGVTLCHDCHKKTESFSHKGSKLNKINLGGTLFYVRTIPHDFQEYETVGNYDFLDNGSIIVFVSDLSNEKFEFLVAVHEICEAVICKSRGIKNKDITDFDINFEKNREPNNHDEPGDAKDAPYRPAHFVATTVERILAYALGVNWNDYSIAVDSLTRTPQP